MLYITYLGIITNTYLLNTIIIIQSINNIIHMIYLFGGEGFRFVEELGCWPMWTAVDRHIHIGNSWHYFKM